MRRLLPPLVALVAAIGLAIPAFAQTPSPVASPSAQPYTGLVEGVTRQYTPDPAKIPADDPEAFVLVSVHLFRFDSEQHAIASWELLTQDEMLPFASLQARGEDAPKVHRESIDDLGNRAEAIWLSNTNPQGDTGHLRFVYVQDGEYVILVSAMGGSGETTRLADDLARAVTDRDYGDEPATFSADGTSTGGIWSKLPLTGDADAHDLTAFADKIIPIP